MEFNDALYFAIGLALFTWIVTRMKMRKKQRLGYMFTHFGNDLNYKAGVLKPDGTEAFAIVIENESEQDLIITDMYIEIKEGNRYKKHPLPADVFDSSKEMIIPTKKQGGAFMDIGPFRKMFVTESTFRTVVSIKGQKNHNSSPFIITGKNKEIALK